MGVYGQYETVAELGHVGPVAVYKARPADGGWDLGFDELGSDANFVLKVFHPSNPADEVGAAAERKQFISRVRTQKRCADAGGRHWAPVLDAGEAKGHAFFVTENFPRTARSIGKEGEDGGVHGVHARSLFAIVEGTLLGLIELKRTQGRPHGNLKSSNILVRSPEGDVASDDVALADPALDQDASIAGEPEDLYCVGELIHELVLGDRFGGKHTWPVPESQRWEALGKHGDSWRGLCNHLLSPRASENWLRAEDVLDEVQSLRPRGALSRRDSGRGWGGRRGGANRGRRMLVAATLLLGVLAGLGAFQYVRYQRQWRELCADYEAWFGPIAQGLEKQAPAAIGGDPYLRERLLKPLNEARAKQTPLDPREIAGTDRPVMSLADRPPMSVGAMWKSERASRVINRVERALSPGQWKSLDEVAWRADEYKARRWDKLAQYAQSLAEGVRPVRGPDGTPHARADWVGAAQRLIEGDALLDRVEAARSAAQSRMASLAQRAAAFPLIKEQIEAFRAQLRGPADADAVLPTAQGVESLARSLEGANEQVAKFDRVILVLEEAARRERAYEVRGWTGPARSIAALIDRAAPTSNGNGQEMDKLAADLAAAKAQWEHVEARWLEIETRKNFLERSGDRILATYKNFVASHKLGEHPDLASLTSTLEKIDDDPAWAAAARHVAQPEFAKFDAIEFARKSGVHKEFIGRSVPTKADLEKWLAEAQGFEKGQLASATMSPTTGTGAAAGSNGTGANGNTSDRVAVTAVPPQAATKPIQIASAIVGATTKPETLPSDVAVITPKVPGTTSPTTVAHASPTTVPYSPGLARGHVPPTTPPRESLVQAPPAIGEIKIADADANAARPNPAVVKPADVNVGELNVNPAMLQPKVPPEVTAFVLNARNSARMGLPVSDKRILEAWSKYGEQAAAAVEKDAKQLPALKAQRDRVRARFVSQLDAAIAKMSAPVELDRAAGKSPWNAALIQRIQAAKPNTDAQVRELIGLAVAGDDQFERRVAAARDADEQWRGGALRLVADANRLESLLAAGNVLSDKAVASALTAVRSADLMKAKDVQQALEPLLRPIAAVENAGSDPGALRDVVASAQRPLGVRLSAWSALAASKEAPTLELLEQDLKLGEVLLAAAQSGMPAGVAGIKSSMESHLRSRWEAVLESAARPEDVQMAMAMQTRIAGVDVGRLPPRSRFNFALRDLRDAIATAKNDDELAKAVAAPAARLLAISRELGEGERGAAQVASLLAEATRVGRPTETVFDKLGPRSLAAGGPVEWSVSVLDGGQAAAYRTTVKTDSRTSEELTLVFRRVKPSQSARASWVMTSEVSLGVFDSLLTAARKWPVVKSNRLLPEYDPTRDLRVGPRAWVWPRFGPGNTGIRHSLVWLSPTMAPPGVDHYPEGIGSAENRSVIGDRRGNHSEELNPFNRRQPMQYLSARAAMLAAEVAGCRLPTPAEWQAAHAETGEQTASSVNLRDRTWRIQLDHMRRTGRGNPRWRPDAGMFAPAGERPSDEITATRTGAELDDGVLWFRPVPEPAPQVFVDLIGNVAEFVADAPRDGASEKAYVIGGSALSPPPSIRPLSRPYPVEEPNAGYSDVGFRLAFGEPAPPVERLREVVAGNWYLTR